MHSLQELHATLRTALANDALVSLIATRIALRTGVDLNAIPPADDRNPELVQKVSEAMTALGFSPATLQVVAQRTSAR